MGEGAWTVKLKRSKSSVKIFHRIKKCLFVSYQNTKFGVIMVAAIMKKSPM